MLKSIIWADKPPVREALMPNFFIDLNLDQIVYKINSLRKHYDVRKLYYMLPENKETLNMRRDVFSDIKKPEIFEAFCNYSEAMKNVRDYLDYSEEIDFEPQKAVLFVTAASYYCKAVEIITGLKDMVSSEELKKLVKLVEEYASAEEYRIFRDSTSALYEEIKAFFYRISLTRDNFTIKSLKGESDYFEKIKRAFPQAENNGFESPFKHRRTLSHMETEAYHAIAKAHPECIKKCKEFLVTHAEFCESAFTDLEFELQLYLSFYIFESYMEENGFSFTTPEINSLIDAEGVYDIALALTLFNHERPVIDNTVSMNEGEKFLVVTGPNQGGKTTYARSIGQLIYFTMMGLDVAAKKASVPFFEGILTHFSVEESTETGQGKLKEELTRLAPMMSGNAQNCFVILNELFTTAATYDAAIMGRRVMNHFTGNGCIGIYVTHIKELASGDGVVSLVAVVDENDYHRRLYKMVRKPADGIGYAGTLVEKYGLTYDMLIDKFGQSDLVWGKDNEN